MPAQQEPGFSRTFHEREPSPPQFGSAEWSAARVLELEDQLTEQKARLDELPEQFAQAIAAALGPVIKEAVKAGVAEALEQEAVVDGFLKKVVHVTSKRTSTAFGDWSLGLIGKGLRTAIVVAALLLVALALGGGPFMVKVWHIYWATND